MYMEGVTKWTDWTVLRIIHHPKNYSTLYISVLFRLMANLQTVNVKLASYILYCSKRKFKQSYWTGCKS